MRLRPFSSLVATPLALALVLGSSGALSAQPANDLCADAALAPLAIGANPYNTSGANTDGTQSACFLWNDVWFTFTPPITGPYTIATCGSSYDTIIQVFGGTLCPDDLNVTLGCNDDGCSLQSSVTVSLVGGQTCMVRAGSFDPAEWGAATLTITSLASLPNDECAGALPAVSGMNPLDTAGATDSTNPYDELTCPGAVLGQMSNDLWWTYTPSAATLRVSTCNLAGDTDIVIYQGGTCGSLVQIGCSGDAPACASFTSDAVVAVTAGVPCRIRIGSFTPGVNQNGSFVVEEAAPEDCGDGVDNDLDGLADCADLADCGALPQCDESLNCTDGIDNDADGDFDCIDPDCAGIFPCPPAPSGDECAIALAMLPGANPYDTLFALDSPEPFSCPGVFPGAMAKDLWWTFTASVSSIHRVENCASNHDSDLAVYAGACGALVPIGCSGDDCGLSSRVDWSAVAGTTYFVRLGSAFAGFVGSGNLILIESGPEQCGDGFDNDLDGLVDCIDTADCPTGIPPCVPPANDSCATPAALLVGSNPYDNTLASDSPEPDSGCPGPFGPGLGAMSLDLWWSFTAAASGLHRVETCGAPFHDSDIEVYDAAGGPCDTGVPVGCSGDSACGPPSRADFIAVAGATYTVRVGSAFPGSPGISAVILSIAAPEDCADASDNDLDGAIDCQDAECACTALCPTPIPGDECCSPLVASVGANAFDSVGMTASSDPFDPLACSGGPLGAMAHDVWFELTASMDGFATWSTCDPLGYDDEVVVYAGADCATKVQVACSGIAPGLPGCQLFHSEGQFPIAAGSTYLIRVGSVSAGVAGAGTLTLFEFCDAPVANLAATADCVSGEVTLAWDPAAFASYDVARSGVSVATGLPAGSTGYVDLAPPNGLHVYEVIGHCAAGGTSPAQIEVAVATYGGEQDLIVRGELGTGLIDSVQALATELAALGRTFLVIDGGIGGYPCADAPFEIVWQMNGTFPDHRCLDGADGAALALLHTAGAGIYTECGDQWGFCGIPTAFDDFDGVSSALDGDNGFTAMDGADSGLGLDLSDRQDVPYVQDQVLNDWTDRLTVAAGSADPGLDGAGAVWSLDDALGAPYVTGVHGIGAGASGSVLSQSWEFGGYGGDRSELAERYVAALLGLTGASFRRGDCKGDGTRNIADAIYGLGALFPPGGGVPNDPPCDDACDANDDGAMNIADMVTILGSLFPPGGGQPSPIPPPFATCGRDPTADPLGCAASPGCP